MDNLLFLALFLFAAVTFYRIRMRQATPKARVTSMLRRYHGLVKGGLSEQEAMLRLLATRADWKKLPLPYLAELVARLQDKDDLMRFISVSEDSGYQRKRFPEFARLDIEAAMVETACLFSTFGFRLQSTGRYKEAEFVQKLALRLQPNQYFATLPLAATYYETGRYAEAVPLFEQGLAQLKDGAGAGESEASPAASKCLGPDAEPHKLRNRYKKMYEACLKANETKPPAGA